MRKLKKVGRRVLFAATAMFSFIAPIAGGVATGMAVYAAMHVASPILAMVCAIVLGWIAMMFIATLLFTLGQALVRLSV